MGEFSSILAAESKPVLLAACQANPSRDKLLEQGQMTLFRSQQTERMVDKNSKELSSRVRVQASFILKVKVLVAQSYPIVCHPMDCSPPVRSVHRILQARILECFAIPFSRNPRINPGSPTLWVDSLPSKPKGVGKVLVLVRLWRGYASFVFTTASPR